MQLRSFSVQGFKNFRQRIVLDDLGPINVIHGPNNVGKSNLIEAFGLFFRLIGETTGTGIPIQTIQQLSDEYLAEAGFPRTEIFNLEAPVPILIEAEVTTTAEDFKRAGLTLRKLTFDRLRVAIELRWMGTHSAYTVRRFQAADGPDFAVETRTIEENADISAVASLLAYQLRITGEASPRFARIPPERVDISNLALALYDAKESADIENSRRWEWFVKAMSEFKDILGEGAFVALYDRKANQANLFYQTARARVPLQLLGSGVQQLAASLGVLSVLGATIVGLEEPELNLRYTLQLRLREVLAKIVGVPGGVEQLFLTSHSDAFEVGSHFYYMETTPDGPSVQRRRIEEARVALGITSEGTLPDPKAVLCYLSTEGVVRVPERIRSAIGLPHGGGVVFLERDGAVEVMSNDAFADRFEPRRGGEGDEQS